MLTVGTSISNHPGGFAIRGASPPQQAQASRIRTTPAASLPASLCLGHHSIGHALLSKLRQPGKNSLAPVPESQCFCVEVQEDTAGASSEDVPRMATSSNAISSGHLLIGLSPVP